MREGETESKSNYLSLSTYEKILPEVGQACSTHCVFCLIHNVAVLCGYLMPTFIHSWLIWYFFQPSIQLSSESFNVHSRHIPHLAGQNIEVSCHLFWCLSNLFHIREAFSSNICFLSLYLLTCKDYNREFLSSLIHCLCLTLHSPI